MPNSFMKNIWRLRTMQLHPVNGFRLRLIRNLPIIIFGFIRRLFELLKPNASKNRPMPQLMVIPLQVILGVTRNPQLKMTRPL